MDKGLHYVAGMTEYLSLLENKFTQLYRRYRNAMAIVYEIYTLNFYNIFQKGLFWVIDFCKIMSSGLRNPRNLLC